MKQVVRRGLKEIIVDEVADPIASPHHVLVRPCYSLISSGTETADIHTDSIIKEVADNPSHLRTVWNVMLKTDPISTINEVRAKFSDYAVLGYSGAGIVVELGEKVTDVEVGTRVAYGGEGTGHGETINVGRNLIAAMPDNVGFPEACFTTLGAIAMNSVRLAEIGVGDTVAVIGLGLIGQLVCQLVRCHGGVVIGIDLDEERVKLAVNAGADFGLVAGEATAAEVAAITNNRGADRVIVAAASSSPQPLHQAVAISRDRGSVVLVGNCPIEIPRAEMYVKELGFKVSRAYGPGSYDPSYEKRGVDYPISYVRWTENRNMQEFLRLVSVGRVDVLPLISHEFPLESASDAYSAIMKGGSSMAVVLKYPASESMARATSFKPVRKIHLSVQPTKKDTLRFALVGAGNLAKWAHLPALGKVKGAKLHAVCSNSGARGKSYATRFNANYSTSDLDEVLHDDQIDVVLIASRHQDHADQIIRSMKAGKHVFVEKPMAVSLKECREIKEAVDASGKRLMVGFNRRFAPYYLEMKRQLSGYSGPIVVSTRMNSPGIENGWAADAEHGGVVLGEGCHFIDLMHWLTESEPTHISAYGFEENNVVASIRFANGSIGTFTYTVVGSNTSGGERVEVFAPGIGLSSQDFKNLTVKKKTSKKTSRWFAAKGYHRQLESFVESLKTGKETDITVVDGFRATLGSLLILDSMRSGVEKRMDLHEFLT